MYLEITDSRIDFPGWADMSDQEREAHLREENLIFDAMFTWRGLPLTQTQQFAFPRYGILTDTVPEQVILGLIKFINARGNNQLEVEQITRKHVRIGELEVEKFYTNGSATANKTMADIRKLVSRYALVGNKIERA